jgi:hypothetical protein
VNIMAMQNKVGVIKMKLEYCKVFAQLCESITEASSAMDLIAGSAGGEQVVKKLHGSMSLAHNISYSPVQKISWKDIKDSYRGAWVIIIGSQGTGAIKASGGNTGTYTAVASSGGDAETMNNSRSDVTMEWLKTNLGRFQKFYVGKNTTYVPDTQRKRASSVAGTSNTVTQSTIINKFKPLWEKAMVAAIADIKGHVSNMIKNDAFEKARTKLSHIETLQNGLDTLQTGGSSDTPGFISNAVNTAVLMAASHHYPDETGEITKGYSRGNYSSQNSEGPTRILQDIAKGDNSKLGTVLAFFKRALISG